ncbi:hypothetical protein [Alloscardovia macacae]|uniref:Uncharacterized protein n=1 Tax=Alloscardovia macacae TaxID=1160091 RepID=A0A1Y2T0C7_9BIFI|nr:hypothetical protein [Alloscardovia macacae]OTA27562.1 hypothetical protein B9G54_00360 [Alloscardovia macacae]OTA30210.1 hypothetical protein B9T39_00440 [Alloscardovia macacae]OZG54419.1 hypothetical protein ALMA_0880 [Alloscardovia macacae]
MAAAEAARISTRPEVRMARPVRTERIERTGRTVRTERTGRAAQAQLELSPSTRTSSSAQARQRPLVVTHVQSLAQNRRKAVVVFVFSVTCLIGSLLGALGLRTLMTENAFSIAQTQSSVSKLKQDVQQDKAKLNELQTSLPERASQLGMQQGTSSMTIDLAN